MAEPDLSCLKDISCVNLNDVASNIVTLLTTLGSNDCSVPVNL